MLRFERARRLTTCACKASRGVMLTPTTWHDRGTGKTSTHQTCQIPRAFSLRIISLSTIPPRFDRLAPTLKSLVEQSGAIDEIRLYIPKRYRRFPDYDGSVPSVPDGITIVRPD